MENKTIELENRITKLETILENIEFSGDGLNITFNKTPLNSVEISGDGANAEFHHCPIGYASTDTTDELEDLEDAADDLECRVEDIKCAAEDVKALINEIEPRVTTLSKQVYKLDSITKGRFDEQSFKIYRFYTIALNSNGVFIISFVFRCARFITSF